MQQALAAITFAAGHPDTLDADGKPANLLDLSIKAIRLRATVGEVSDAMEKAFGRHRADTNKVSGVYAAAYDSAKGETMDYWNQLKADIATFAEREGRRRAPRGIFGCRVLVEPAILALAVHQHEPGCVP